MKAVLQYSFLKILLLFYLLLLAVIHKLQIQKIFQHGKLRAFKLGEILRQKYNDFLGSTYLQKDVKFLSSDFERTKMSLQLVLAGLYPPNSLQKWKADLNWQPIPFRSIHPISKDYIFRRFETCQK